MRPAQFPSPRASVDLAWQDRKIALEYQWVGVASEGPVVVFLHEGLGSIDLWKNFPHRFCEKNGLTGLVFSRYGYGRSTPRLPEERWPVSFMHAQAHDVLPRLFDKLDIRKPWLFGHSDGASIALLYAAWFSDNVSGIVVVAPHIFVEDKTVESIAAARQAYLSTELRNRLARYHQDVDSAFWGWNDIWLDPAFRTWNIEECLSSLACPVMAVQGEDDEYGSLEQIRGIKKKAPHTQLSIFPRCGHSPHRDQPEKLIQEAGQFVQDAMQNATRNIQALNPRRQP
ncbi:alpha/beta fold hydrolase [Noviherbaspirillum galbum]|uniref:Alpha/beta hydrolase n=1 Tax=Noviherbaspirillum galbum TaxID=2709383 RepID=A0A6B3SIZ4_9BURK|nr:alpha/beta hydrolase [Noviherbaspirillum galbum]NEX60801.1 alpha/beta hydrolase [Noviherbaspirillum galbum]